MQKVSFQGSNNAVDHAALEAITGNKIINGEVFKGKNEGHKYQEGQQCCLVGLEDYPEFNGEIVEITSIREDGKWGKAYYFKAENPKISTQLNWTYEYRLKKI